MSKAIKGLTVSLQASELSFGELEHPNKMPFSGIMTWFDVPSDKPVGGSGGKRVVIPSEYGIPALATLKGMAVNFDSLFMDKHLTKNKIGIIEDFEVGEKQENGGVPISVSGYIYAHDFPDEAAEIKEEQSDLGFSYETIDTPVMDGVFEGESVLMVCDDFTFSGAAILLKEKGAYTNTSLAASADETTKEVTELNLDEIIAAVISAMEAKYNLQMKSQVEAVQEALSEVVSDHMEAESNLTQAHMETESKLADVQDMVDGLCANGEGEVKTEEVKTEEKGLNAEAEVETKVEPVVEEKADETLDFKAMAEDYKTQMESIKAELDKMKADLKAEADAKEVNTHKGFAYPTTLAAKYSLEASADTYDAKIKAVDGRTDLSSEEKMALKFELRDKELKTQK